MSEKPSVRFLDQNTPPHISTLILLAGIAALAMNIFLPSLPGMTTYFAADYRIMQLSVALYLGVNAALQLFVGPMSDRFGRRPVILIGLYVFLFATLGCLLASNVYVFLFFRMLQASVVVAMVLSRAIIRDMVPQDQAASMIGYVTMGMAIVPMIGPAIGGVLDKYFGWHAVFLALLLSGALVTWMAQRDLGETAPGKGQTFRDQMRDYPELLTSPRFWGYSSASALSSGSFFAYLGGAPYVGVEIFKLDPAQLGFYFGAPAVGYLVGNFLSGRYSVKIGVNRMVLWGTLIDAIGLGGNLLLVLSGAGTVISFFGLMVFMGLGNGMTIPNATAGALSVRPRLAGTASGLSGALMIGGGAALSALSGALLKPGTGAQPLLWIMLITALLGVLAILLVIRRERNLLLSR